MIKRDPKIGHYWPGVYRIKDMLRSVRETAPEKRNAFVVHSERASGKTTGLEQFVAERTLILPFEEKIAVICPNNEIANRFGETFVEDFPTLRPPIILNGSSSTILEQNIAGQAEIVEVYIEEIFLLSPRTVDWIRAYYGSRFIAGVGTLEHTALINVVDW